MTAEGRSAHPGLSDFALDGRLALEHVVAASEYGSLTQAVASLVLFSHPSTVEPSAGKAIFRIVRATNNSDRGKIGDAVDGRPAVLDDNTGPTDTFLWANGIGRSAYRDVQFCHVWPRPRDPESYTSLANICVLPTFLAKLSDTHPEVARLLRGRAVGLYGWKPDDAETADQAEVAELSWAECLPPVADLAASLRAGIARNPRSRTAMSARTLGWLFGAGRQPDAPRG
jgi:hypothetical protein